MEKRLHLPANAATGSTPARSDLGDTGFPLLQPLVVNVRLQNPIASRLAFHGRFNQR